MSGGSTCVNPGAGWTDTNGSNKGSHVTNGEQYRVYRYHDFTYTDIVIEFTIDSEVSKQELIDSINSMTTDKTKQEEAWGISTSTNNKMEITCTKNGTPAITVKDHSSNLDAYGTQYYMGLCQEDLNPPRPYTLAASTPLHDGSSFSYTMTDAYGKDYTFTCPVNEASIKSDVTNHLKDLISSYTYKIQQNLNMGGTGNVLPPSTSSTRTLTFTSGEYWMTFEYKEDLNGFLNSSMFDKKWISEPTPNNPNAGRWEVNFNQGNMGSLQSKADSLAADIMNSLKDIEIDIKTNGKIEVTNGITAPKLTENIRYNTQVISGGREIKIQSSDNAWDHIKIELPGMNAAIIGVSDLDVSSYAAASASIEKIHKAIDIVSGMRSHFGALQNRMESAMAVDDIMAENTQAAESRIRDADMAKESLEFTKHNILKQAAESVLAQANHSKDGILSLLQ